MTTNDPTPNKTFAGWLRNKSRGFVAYWKGSTSRVNVLIGGVFVFIGFSMVYVQLRTINDRQRDADLRATEQAIFQTELDAYTQQVADFRLCLDSVGRSDANRGQWVLTVDILRKLGANELADQLAAGPLLVSEPRLPADCTDPGPPPTPPE